MAQGASADIIDAAKGDLLAAAIAATDSTRPSVEDDLRAELVRWLAERKPPAAGGWTRQSLLAALDREIAALDGLLSRQVNAILHHPRFQKLEAAWRGIAYLVDANQDSSTVKVRVLSVTWEELCRDLERAMEFDHSQLFQKIYGEEFDMPGGQPFGLLIGDYEVQHTRSAEHPTDDVAALRAIAQVAAAAFAPFVVAASPTFFEFDSFADLIAQRFESIADLLDPRKLTVSFRSQAYARWQSLRDSEDARFIGITLPRILMRLPYHDDSARSEGFRFTESTDDRQCYLWGSATFAFAAVAMRSYAESGWFTDIRGARRSGSSGGKVQGLPMPYFDTDRPDLIKRFAVEVALTEPQERELIDLGFIPLVNVQYTGYAAFYSNQSIQSPKAYSTAAGTANARISAMLQYILSVSRFAHYVKIIARERVGSFFSPEECEEYLQKWLRGYCNSGDGASPATMARYPLREASVQVREPEGRPGVYQCTVHLRPHSQADQIISEFRLVTNLPSLDRAA